MTKGEHGNKKRDKQRHYDAEKRTHKGDKHKKQGGNSILTESSKHKLLPSNSSRYDKVDNEENVSLDEDLYDETKDFEYIKTHAGGASSHFQFQEEREWQDQLKDESDDQDIDNILELNLKQLAEELSSLDMMEKLKLDQLGEDYKYCFDNLKKLRDSKPTEARSIPSNLNNNFTWTFKGVEKYKDLFKRMKSNKERILCSHDNLKPETEDNKFQVKVDSGKVNTVPLPSNTTQTFDITFEKSISVESETSEEQNNDNLIEKTSENTIPDDVDLDMLLETTDPVSSSSEVNTLKTETPKELDDWLDSMLD
ncbi:glutamic acid-rich protein-like isoform X3 [Hydractinia symbiolongicarpus]|uniref:glutamic acid-rich protein-like isoform X3 n=1 Tax=Hydractinia symbiolongicarpus TaxID=13093 RepID=UPI00254D6B10|nr:glutamic acid-rich protein-like isoform X3 [Hydractinia symbiolongicarpus]